MKHSDAGLQSASADPATSGDCAPAPSIVIQERSNWKSFCTAGITVHYAGDRRSVEQVVDALTGGGKGRVENALRATNGHFAGIIETANEVVAFTDHCRSIPVFHDKSGRVSNAADALQEVSKLREPEPFSILELGMAGYVTGKRTLFRDLYQLQAGEVFQMRKKERAPQVSRYYRYMTKGLRRDGEVALKQELGAILDRSTKRVIEEADGRAVWVALSGGLDSRILLCKLVEHGCPNLRTFSYGPRFNDELRIGREVARHLKVRWDAVPSTGSRMHSFFHSQIRRDWWTFASNLASVPGPSGALTLAQLTDRGVLKPGDLMINGQSGDFITGAHIPNTLCGGIKSGDDLLKSLVNKHFSLWNSLKTQENLADIEEEMLKKLGIRRGDRFSDEEICALYECYEYDERQAKYVINAQRNYEFFGLDWRFPLWDREFVDFWRDIPLDLKVNRRLFREYLEEYDYKRMFRDFQPTVSQWPWPGKSLLALSRLIRLTAGTAARDRFQKRANYIGIYHYMYAAFGFQIYQRHAHNLRSPVSLFAMSLLRENGLPLPGGFEV